MPGILLDGSAAPMFFFEKLADEQIGDDVMGAIMAMVESMGFEVVFGRIFRWEVDLESRKVMEKITREMLDAEGIERNRYSKQQAMTIGAGNVTLCHEAYILSDEADKQVAQYGLEHEMKYMVGFGRIHENGISTLMTPVKCMVTTVEGMFKAMHGIEHKMVDTEDSHSIVIFYDEYVEEDGDEDASDNNTPDVDANSSDPE